MGGRRCEGYGVCSDAAQQHFAKGKMLGGRSAVKKVREDFFDKLSAASYRSDAFAILFTSLCGMPAWAAHRGLFFIWAQRRGYFAGVLAALRRMSRLWVTSLPGMV